MLSDPQAIGNSLFGMQRMKSNSPEVRALVQALTTKIAKLKIPMDSAGIGAAIYGDYTSLVISFLFIRSIH